MVIVTILLRVSPYARHWFEKQIHGEAKATGAG